MKPGIIRLSLLLLTPLLFFSLTVVAADLSPRMKLMAKRAAKVDALRNLAETVYGLRLDAVSTVNNFVLRSDVLRSRLDVAIQGAREVDYQELPDGTAEVTIEISLGTVETILGRRLEYDQQIIEAVGYGAPPGMAPGHQTDSSGDTVTATGYGLPPNDPALSAVESDLLGFRAAKIDAMRNLAEQINRIHLTAETTVQDFSVQNDEVRARINSIINGARVISEKRLADSRYEIILETNIGPLRNLPN